MWSFVIIGLFWRPTNYVSLSFVSSLLAILAQQQECCYFLDFCKTKHLSALPWYFLRKLHNKVVKPPFFKVSFASNLDEAVAELSLSPLDSWIRQIGKVICFYSVLCVPCHNFVRKQSKFISSTTGSMYVVGIIDCVSFCTTGRNVNYVSFKVDRQGQFWQRTQTFHVSQSEIKGYEFL